MTMVSAGLDCMPTAKQREEVMVLQCAPRLEDLPLIYFCFLGNQVSIWAPRGTLLRWKQTPQAAVL